MGIEEGYTTGRLCTPLKGTGSRDEIQIYVQKNNSWYK
jgi:hypothetical protein